MPWGNVARRHQSQDWRPGSAECLQGTASCLAGPKPGATWGTGKAREAGWSLASQDLKCQAEQPDFILKTEPGEPYWEPSNLEGHPAAGAQGHLGDWYKDYGIGSNLICERCLFIICGALVGVPAKGTQLT